jgi:pyruvate/2-oxoacid:ferredoxin oxidoreductase alpha subunit
MSSPIVATIDGNEAVARIAYALNEVVALYPITPATQMGEWADACPARGNETRWRFSNIWPHAQPNVLLKTLAQTKP